MKKVQITEKFIKDLIAITEEFGEDLEQECESATTLRSIGRSEYLIDLIKEELASQEHTEGGNDAE